jgi:hypothetical protein
VHTRRHCSPSGARIPIRFTNVRTRPRLHCCTLREGLVGERSQFYATSFKRKRGARHGSMICRLMPESTLSTRLCESFMHPLFSMTLTYGLLPTFLFRPQSRTCSQHRTHSSTTPYQIKLSSRRTWMRTPAKLILTRVDLPHSHQRIHGAGHRPRQTLGFGTLPRIGDVGAPVHLPRPWMSTLLLLSPCLFGRAKHVSK